MQAAVGLKVALPLSAVPFLYRTSGSTTVARSGRIASGRPATSSRRVPARKQRRVRVAVRHLLVESIAELRTRTQQIGPNRRIPAAVIEATASRCEGICVVALVDSFGLPRVPRLHCTGQALEVLGGGEVAGRLVSEQHTSTTWPTLRRALRLGVSVLSGLAQFRRRRGNCFVPLRV